MIKCKNIYKNFHERDILKDVNLSIKNGEITLLSGPSGGGKSTLLRIMSGLDKADKGQVFLNQMDIDTQTDIYPDISIVFQQLFLWPHLSNRENITLAFDKTSRNDLVEYYIEYFGLEECIDKYPNESSLGQKQRIALIRALVLEPKYLLLDEVTSALDKKNVVKVIDLLKKLQDKNTAILIISHDMRVLNTFKDNQYHLENGNLS